jgi:hypothetical protein
VGNQFNSFIGQLAVARGQRDNILNKSTQRHLLRHTQLSEKGFKIPAKAPLADSVSQSHAVVRAGVGRCDNMRACHSMMR